MKTLLLDMWYNNVHLNENTMRESAKEKELTAQLEQYCEYIEKLLPGDKAEIVEKCKDCFWELLEQTDQENFIHGFRFGVRLLLEALSEES